MSQPPDCCCDPPLVLLEQSLLPHCFGNHCDNALRNRQQQDLRRLCRERPSLVGRSNSKTALKKRKAEAAKAKGHKERRQRARAQAAAQAPGDAMAGYQLD